MRKITFLLLFLIINFAFLSAQVKIGDNPTTINGGSVLELESTNKGVLFTRVNLTSTTVWSLAGTAVNGMMVYNTNTGIIQGNTNYPTIVGGKGMYYWDGTGWVAATFNSNNIGGDSIVNNPTINIIEGEGAPTGSCTNGDLYIDVLEGGATEGNMWYCNGGSWVTYTPSGSPDVNKTEWYFTGTQIDAQGNKTLAIWRKGYIGISNKYTPFKPKSPIHVLNNNGNNGSGDNITIESYMSSTSPYPRYYGKVGRGTFTSPSYLLDGDELVALAGAVAIPTGTGTAAKGMLGIYADGNHSATSTPTKIYFRTTNAGSTSTTVKMTIKESGYVGIGTTTPKAPLHIYDVVDVNPVSSSTNKGTLLIGDLSAFYAMYDNNELIAMNGTTPSSYGINSVDAGFPLGNVGIGNNGTTSGQMLVVSGSENRSSFRGNVGIQTQAPDAPLHINSTRDVSTSSNGTLLIGPESGNRVAIDNNEMYSFTSGSTPGGFTINGNIGNGQVAGQVAFGYDGRGSMAVINSANRKVELGQDGSAWIAVPILILDGNTGSDATSEFRGFVGIGSTPTHAKLDVNGWNLTNVSAGKYFGNTSTALQTWTGGNRFLSIWASHAITAPSFYAYSDKRIKNNIKSTATSTELNFINKINIVSYNYIDNIQNGNQLQKGVIAQEIEKIAPEAITTLTDFVPNVYTVSTSAIEDKENKTLTVTVNKVTDFKVGDKVRIISYADGKEYEVIAVNGDYNFTIKDWNEQLNENSVFVYGKQVDDYKSVNYDYLYTANIAATQELYKMIIDLQNENVKLKSEMSKVNSLQGQMDIIKAQLDALLPNTKTTEK